MSPYVGKGKICAATIMTAFHVTVTDLLQGLKIWGINCTQIILPPFVTYFMIYILRPYISLILSDQIKNECQVVLERNVIKLKQGDTH
jgi:hypothetical protein